MTGVFAFQRAAEQQGGQTVAGSCRISTVQPRAAAHPSCITQSAICCRLSSVGGGGASEAKDGAGRWVIDQAA